MMKGDYWFLEKSACFSSLHMKRKSLVSKNEKCFNFLKMDKKKSKIDLPKYSLLTDFFDLIMKFYGLILNHVFYFCYDNFLYFFLKNDLGFFRCIY